MRKLLFIIGLFLGLSLIFATPVMAASVKVEMTPVGGAQGSALITLRDTKVDAATDSAELIVRLTLKDAVPNRDYWVFLKVDGGPSFALGKAGTNHKGHGAFTGAITIDNLTNPLNHTFALHVTSPGPNLPGDLVFDSLGFTTMPFK